MDSIGGYCDSRLNRELFLTLKQLNSTTIVNAIESSNSLSNIRNGFQVLDSTMRTCQALLITLIILIMTGTPNTSSGGISYDQYGNPINFGGGIPGFTTSTLGAGSNTAPSITDPNPIHTGSWGLPDLGLTESLQGQNNSNQPAPFDINQYLPQTTPVAQPTNGNLSQGAVIDAYNKMGWTDTNAIMNDYNATGGSKLSGGSTGGTGGTPDKTVSRTGDPRAALVISNPNTNTDFQNSGLNIDEYLATIDSEYQNNQGLLNKQESSIRANQPGIEQGITDQANVLKNKAGTVKEDALSAARRLYAELQQGYKQRFGGASSAGEAAQALTGNEQQRQMAQTNRSYQESVSQVDLSASQATQSAQNEFRTQLLAVDQNRTATENDRLNARRQALTDLSQKVFAIQQQATTFKQNLQLMQEQARLQNEANLKGMSTNPTSTLTTNGMQTTASGNQGLSTAVGAIGNMSSGITKNTDPLANGVYPIASMTNGQTKYSDGSIR